MKGSSMTTGVRAPVREWDWDAAFLPNRHGLAEDIYQPLTRGSGITLADYALSPSLLSQPWVAAMFTGGVDLSPAADGDALVRCGCAYCMKGTSSFFEDGVGDGKPGAPLQPLLVTTDTIPGDTSTTHTLTVDGPHIIGTLDTVGDQDFYAVELVAGQLYDIGMFAHNGGPNLLGVADSYLELYDADGNLILTADGGAPGDDLGLDAVLTYRAEYTGTYYVNARAYDDVPANGTTGDFVGDYEIFVDTNDGFGYVPFYTPDSPLHSIDWGTQVDRTSRNPDGDNGTRTDNGVPNGGTPIDNNPYGIVGKNVITYYFAETGDIFVSEDPANPGLTTTIVAQGMQQWEKDAFEAAFDLYEQVADIVYVQVFTREEADFKIITYEGTPGAGASLLGRMSPPGTANEGQMEINTGDVRWTEEGVSPGGFYFPTLLHELGHGHGLAHPHDNGGRSSIMNGAGPSDDPVEGAIGGGLGDFDLSQQVFTIMSYNDGWSSSPYGQPSAGGVTGTEADHYGWVASLSPLDIAVIQDKYGVNEEWATGNDVYLLKDVNAAGTFYSSIWDGGGTDEIRYDGAAAAHIDLRPATLQYEEGGGGRVSYAWGIHGGFTIANGVTVEKATGGSGDDTLIGNDAANVLNGRGGADHMTGGLGDDWYHVDSMGDVIVEAEGEGDVDRVFASVSYALTAGAAIEILSTSLQVGTGAIDLTGNELNNVVVGNNGANRLDGGDGADSLYGHLGSDILIGGLGDDRLDGGLGVDTADYSGATGGVNANLLTRTATGQGNDLLLDIENLVGSSFNDILRGSAAANELSGGDGDDILDGREGADTLIGGLGNDWHYVDNAGDVVVEISGEGSVDRVFAASSYQLSAAAEIEILSTSLQVGVTAIDLTGNAFSQAIVGNNGANRLDGGAGHDTLYGHGGADVLIGGSGDDVMWGGGDADVFLYRTPEGGGGLGSDLIRDFADGVDRIQLDGIAGVDDFADLSVSAGASGWAVIGLPDGTTITLMGVTTAQVDAADFIFGP